MRLGKVFPAGFAVRLNFFFFFHSPLPGTRRTDLAEVANFDLENISGTFIFIKIERPNMTNSTGVARLLGTTQPVEGNKLWLSLSCRLWSALWTVTNIVLTLSLPSEPSSLN